jgi:HAD superfamily hydrolase (TIGR01490 family)
MANYAFFDIDNTIYDGYTTSGFYLFLARRGIKTQSTLNQDRVIGQLYRSGQIDYSEATRRVIHLQAQIIKGLSVEQVNQLQDQFIQNNPRIFPWVKPLFRLLESRNFTAYLLSAAASPIAQAVARYLHTDKYFTSELEIKHGKYTGNVLNILNDEAKSQTIHRILGHLSQSSYKIGFGDSTGDLAMLELMDDAFVINPHQPQMKTLVRKNHWHLVTHANILHQVKQLPLLSSGPA